MDNRRSIGLILCRTVFCIACGLAAVLPGAALALDYNFSRDMVYWSPLNSVDPQLRTKSTSDAIPYCQINIDDQVAYMEAYCYQTDTQPQAWIDRAGDSFFSLKFGTGPVERCTYRFYWNREILLVTGCRLAGTWSHHKFWKTE